MNLSEPLKAIYTEKIFSGKKHWYGGSESRTNAQSFFYNKAKETVAHRNQMRAVQERLVDLATSTWDGNHKLVVDLIYSRSDSDMVVIAYRFTSDWAADTYSSELISTGPILGRGAFRPYLDDLDTEQLIA